MNNLSSSLRVHHEYHDYPPSGDQGLAFQAHALQIILFGPLTCEPNTILGSLQIESLQLYLAWLLGKNPKFDTTYEDTFNNIIFIQTFGIQ